jgi:hypothetical protein
MHHDPARIHFRRMAVLGTAAAALAAGCATARLASGWAPSSVTANGLADEWSDKQACTTMKDGLQLTVANDAERLYVMAKFRANDPQWSRATSHGGMTLRVVGPGKRVMGFRLPGEPERAPGPSWQARSGDARDTIRNSRADLAAEAHVGQHGHVPAPMWAELEGKLVVTDVDKLDIPVVPDGSQGPAAGFSSVNGMCIYEFSIPLNDSALGHYSLGAGVGTGLNLTVTAGPGAAQREAIRGEMARGGGPPQGDGGPGNGGMPGGRGGFGGGGPSRGRPQGGPAVGHTEMANPSVSVAVRLAVEP